MSSKSLQNFKKKKVPFESFLSFYFLFQKFQLVFPTVNQRTLVNKEIQHESENGDRENPKYSARGYKFFVISKTFQKMASQIGSKRAFENSDPETPVEIGIRKRPASLRRKRIPKRYCDDGSPSPAAFRLIEDDQFKVEAVDEEEIEVKEEDAVESEEEDDFYIGNQVEEIGNDSDN